MYRTGDLVKRLPNGTFEFLGRLDQQVKIRGHRIELGEIESVLASHPGIERSVAVAYEGADGHQNLAVYFIGAAGATTSSSEIRLFLGDLLPPYMIPASFIPVSGFPLTPSGKLDRKALPPPDAPVLETDATFVEPVTPREKQLADIWGEMLNHNPVGLHDNFFDLGGHSLLALRTINEINKRLGVFLNVPDFFQSPTIEQLGRTIDHRMHAKPASQVVQIQQGRAGLPVYFIGARPDEYRLAQMIGGDRSIFVIDALIPTKWISAVANEDQAVLPTIEQLGELFGRALVAHAGSDPCIIAGYSLGGKIAFEAAHKLQQAGGNARFVLLVDARSFAWSGASRIVAIWRSLWMVLGNDVQGNNEGISYKRKLGTVSKGFVRLARWQIAEIRKAIKYRYEISCRRLHAARNHVMPVAKPSGYVDSNGKPIDMWYIHRLSALAGRSWRPRPLDTAGVLIRVKTRIDILPSYDRANGWRDLFANGLEIVQADGNHMSILTGDHAISLARQLNDVLDRYGSFQITPEAAFKNIDTGLTPEQCGLKQVPLKNQVEDLDICVPVAGRP
jgi:thioesterase domain-containing protein